jgi:hypothetical protein
LALVPQEAALAGREEKSNKKKISNFDEDELNIGTGTSSFIPLTMSLGRYWK